MQAIGDPHARRRFAFRLGHRPRSGSFFDHVGCRLLPPRRSDLCAKEALGTSAPTRRRRRGWIADPLRSRRQTLAAGPQSQVITGQNLADSSFQGADCPQSPRGGVRQGCPLVAPAKKLLTWMRLRFRFVSAIHQGRLSSALSRALLSFQASVFEPALIG